MKGDKEKRILIDPEHILCEEITFTTRECAKKILQCTPITVYYVFDWNHGLLEAFVRNADLPSPEEDDTLSVKEVESARSGESPSISGIDSSEDGTDES